MLTQLYYLDYRNRNLNKDVCWEVFTRRLWIKQHENYESRHCSLITTMLKCNNKIYIYIYTHELLKVKLSLCFFNRAPRHEDVLGEWRYSSTHSLTTALDGGEWSASRPGRFTPRDIAPGTHWKGGWIGPRAVPVAVVKRKISSPRRESNHRTPIVQPVARRYTDWAITVNIKITKVELEQRPAVFTPSNGITVLGSCRSRF
jgi:hypothetical protein